MHLIKIVIAAFIIAVSGQVKAASDVAYLKKDCTAYDPSTCFTTSADLTSWLKGARKPNANSPIHVQIGVGVFDNLRLRCDSSFTGYVSVRGAGRFSTIFFADNGYAVSAVNCTNVEFSDLTIRNVVASGGAISWSGGGESRWNNVEVDAVYYGWLEQSCGSIRGKHYWTGSRIMTAQFGSDTAYSAQCDESWIQGSEVTAKTSATLPGTSSPVVAVAASGGGEVHVYGSVIRVLIEKATAGLVAAATAENGGQIHIHGTGIDVISSVGKNITALYAATNGAIHANETAYNMRTGTGGTVTRILNQGGHIQAPYFWGQYPTPQHPSLPNIISETGADTATITSGTLDGRPHLVVYDSTCSSSRWYDTNDKVCR